jgi:hypothetical protein
MTLGSLIPAGRHFMRWSPDGNWVLFDRVEPQGGDIWLLEGLE